MTAKQYLSKAHHLHRQCESLEHKLIMLRSKAEGLDAVRYDADKVKATPANSMENALAELVDVEMRYKNLIVKYNRAIITISKQIQNMTNQTYAEILRLRYLEEDKDGRQLTLAEISKEMGYSIGRAEHLHGEALKAFEKQYFKS